MEVRICMKFNKTITIILLAILLNNCHGFSNIYTTPSETITEYSNYLGPILSDVRFLNISNYSFLHNYLQPILPFFNESYEIELSVANFNNILEDVGGDMLFIYVSEPYIIFPSGKTINLLNNDISIRYNYRESGKITGIQYLILNNVRPQYENEQEILKLNTINNGDTVTIIFKTRVPSYSINNLIFDFTLTIAWENLGILKRRSIMFFKKEKNKWFLFTV